MISKIAVIFKYSEKFSHAREIIIKLEMNLNHYKNSPNNNFPISDENIKEFKDIFFEAKNLYEELFDIEYKYYYQNQIQLQQYILQKESDLDSKLDFFDEILNSTSEEYYIYNNEELTNFNLNFNNNMCNNSYLLTFYN